MNRTEAQKIPWPIIGSHQKAEQHIKYITDSCVSLQKATVKATSNVGLPPKADKQIKIRLNKHGRLKLQNTRLHWEGAISHNPNVISIDMMIQDTFNWKDPLLIVVKNNAEQELTIQQGEKLRALKPIIDSTMIPELANNCLVDYSSLISIKPTNTPNQRERQPAACACCPTGEGKANSNNENIEDNSSHGETLVPKRLNRKRTKSMDESTSSTEE